MAKALIIGCGGVAGVAIHKCCQNSDVFEEICIASRTLSRCEAVKKELEGKTRTRITIEQVDADDVTKATPPPKPREPGEAVPEEPPAAGEVSVTVDTLQTIPGALVSGGAVFSDGTKARWYFDQMGRFGFEPELPGYKPSVEDSRIFQQKLQQELSSRGY